MGWADIYESTPMLMRFFCRGTNSPITMGFGSPSQYLFEIKSLVVEIGQPMSLKRFVHRILSISLFDCNEDEAEFSDSKEIKRHVFEAMDVLFPQHTGNHSIWYVPCHSRVFECIYLSHNCVIVTPGTHNAVAVHAEYQSCAKF